MLIALLFNANELQLRKGRFDMEYDKHTFNSRKFVFHYLIKWKFVLQGNHETIEYVNCLCKKKIYIYIYTSLYPSSPIWRVFFST